MSAQDVNNSADGKFVVIENGRRVTAPTASRAEAEADANQRNRLSEAAGHVIPENKKAQVKRNLMG